MKLRANFGDRDLGETIEIWLENANGTRTPVANALNFDDCPWLDESKCEDRDILASVIAALFVASPAMLKACKLAFEYTNTCHMLTQTARAELCQQAFEACRDALDQFHRPNPQATTDYILNQLGLIETGV